LPQASDATNGLSCAARCRNKPAWMAFGRGELWSMAGRPSVAPWVCLLLLCDRAHISAAASTLWHPGWGCDNFRHSSNLALNITYEGEPLGADPAAVQGRAERRQMGGLCGWRSRTTARCAAGSPEMRSRGRIMQLVLKAPRWAPTTPSPTCATTGERSLNHNTHHRAHAHWHNTHTGSRTLTHCTCLIACAQVQMSWSRSSAACTGQ